MGVMHSTDSGHAVPARTFHFQDGGQAIYFSFDKSLQQWPPAATLATPDTYLFVVPGSDCASMAQYLPQYFRGLEGESGAVRIFILHKRFIQESSWNGVWGCSRAFIDVDYPSRWVADQTEFITTQLQAAQSTRAQPKRVVLVGISEGGEIVPLLARSLPAVTHVALLSNGGMNPMDVYRMQAQRHGFAAAGDFDGTDLATAREGMQQYISGRRPRYWLELQQITHSDNLLALSIPLLIAMGENDQSVPIESAWYIRDQFALRGKSNLTLLTYPGADHGLATNRHAHLPDFWHALDLWLEK